jgi:CHASE2 domain-containing sensor protein
LNQAAYDRSIRRLRVCVRVLSAVLLALVARSVIDGANLAVVLTAALIALLLLASAALLLYGRRLEPHASASPTTTPTARRETRIAATDRHEPSGTQ